MFRLALNSFKNCSNFKVVTCSDCYVHICGSVPARTLTTKPAKVIHRRFSKVTLLKTRKSLTNSNAISDCWKSGCRFRSSGAAAAATASDSDELENADSSNPKSSKKNAKVFPRKRRFSQPSPPPKPSTLMSFKSAFTSSPLGTLIFPPAAATVSELRVFDDSYIPPKPLKLIDTVDPTVLSGLYKSNLSPLALYMALSKFRLTTFVVITAAAGYGLGNGALDSGLVWISLGTFLTSASANTFNQIIEVNYDKLMDRTKNRVLVKKLMSKQHAMWFGVVSGLTGAATLYSVNELSSIIGLINLGLYVGAYTPLKRKHIVNTWVGSVVGALPPLIGYAGATGMIDSKALVLSAVMFCWQFPHFNALSWNLRNDYDRAGYKMMCFANERLCRHTTLRYSLLLTGICLASPLTGVSDVSFVIDSGVLNAYLCYLSWQFYKEPDAKSARKLFRYTLIHLPVLIMFLFISNKAVKKPKVIKAD